MIKEFNIYKLKLKIILISASLAFLLCLSFSIDVFAADARNYNPGNIISDAIFTNDESMSVDAIQNFLNSKVSCDTFGNKTSELGGGTRAQYLASRGISTPIKCINNFYENVSSGENNYGKTYIPSGAISAAQIIYNYSKQFNINPQVILVTLQKENGLITDEWPLPIQYTQAMGFGCPDNVTPGAPACDPNYGSFSAQIYQAARHFRGYINNTSGWYISFNTGNNNIKWNPNSGCGSSSVNIENRSTVALYTYTPYRPNQAALNAQYGTGDGCSSYGNRNFYLYFNDWFGSTQFNYSIIRTFESGGLYLVYGNIKYYIPSMQVYEQLKSISDIGFVSSDYLNGLETSLKVASRLIRNADNGAIYLIDSGYKIHFTSCSMVSDYGYDCDNALDLSSAQVAKYKNGPNVTNFFNTSSGQRFYIKSGEKREILDTKSLQEAGLSGFANTLSSGAISNLPYGVPIVRDDVIFIDKNSNELWYYYQNKVLKVENTNLFKSKSSGYLNNLSISKMGHYADIYRGLVKCLDGKYYIVTNNSRVQIYKPDELGLAFLNVGSVFDDIIKDNNKDSTIIKSNYDSAVYKVYNGIKYHITSNYDLAKFAKDLNRITTVSKTLIDSLPNSDRVMFSPAQLIKGQSDSKVYMIDGLSGSKIYLSSFVISNDLGVSNKVRTVSDSSLNKYNTKPYNLTNKISCNNNYYFGIGGVIYKLDDDMLNRYGFTKDQFVIISEETCEHLSAKVMTATFLRNPSTGAIYYVDNGKKSYIGSYGLYVNLGGSRVTTLDDASNILLNSILNS